MIANFLAGPRHSGKLCRRWEASWELREASSEKEMACGWCDRWQWPGLRFPEELSEEARHVLSEHPRVSHRLWGNSTQHQYYQPQSVCICGGQTQTTRSTQNRQAQLCLPQQPEPVMVGLLELTDNKQLATARVPQVSHDCPHHLTPEQGEGHV